MGDQLIPCGHCPSRSAASAWLELNSEALAISFINCLAYACGDLPGSYAYSSRWGPSYRQSHAITLAALSATVILVFITRRHLRSLNEDLDRAIELVQIPDDASAPSSPGKVVRLNAALGSAISNIAAHRRMCAGRAALLNPDSCSPFRYTL